MVAAPDDRFVVALASLPAAGPIRLRALLERYGPQGAWAAVLDGQVDPVVFRSGVRSDPRAIVARWSHHARDLDPEAYWSAHLEAGIGVATVDSPAFPVALAQDDDPPPVIFWKGDPDHVAGMRVGIVGTRDATRYGIDLAHLMGRELAERGVGVVSGLALGIDGAAHAGVLATEDGAAPIGVVGSGLDRVYPRDHRGLWRAVSERGVLFSEYPLGTPAAAWRFPARNRLIAALADVLVVVESHATGGAMGTAVEADRRGRTVLAVPGPVTAGSSDGTNQLLFEGRGPARDTADVLLALGIAGGAPRTAEETRPRPTGDAAAVLDAMPWQPVALEQLVLLTGLDVGTVALALDDLDRDGWVARRSGWVERVGRGPRGGAR
jgi:DNA processing protein